MHEIKTKLSENRIFIDFDDPVIRDYFKADDYLNYYYSMLTQGQRDISEEIYSFGYKFLLSLDSKDVAKKVEHVIKGSYIGKVDISKDINKIAKSINPEGYRLLEIKSPLTKEYLSECYRVASKKYHPDRGGDEDKMKVVNNAVGQYRNLLNQFLVVERNEVGYEEDDYREIKSLEDFRYALAELLLVICIDIYKLDEAYEVLKVLDMILDKHKKYNMYFSEGNIYELSRLAILFNQAGKKKQSNDALEVLKKISEQLLYNTHAEEQNRRLYLDCKKSINNNDSISLRCRHGIQIANAHKYGLISERKCRDLSQKNKQLSSEVENYETSLNQYAEEEGFIEDLGIYELLDGNPIKTIIPGPEWGAIRYEQLSNDQKKEYLNAFKYPIDINLIKKYKRIRSSSYMIALIKNYNGVIHSKIVNECELLKEALEDDSFSTIIAAYNYLSNLNVDQRNERLDLLKSMDEATPFKLIDSPGNIRYIDPTLVNRKPISPSFEYMYFIQLPMAKLLDFKKCGKDPYQDDNNKIYKFSMTEIYKNRHVGIRSKNDPKDIVEIYEAYLTAELELMPKLHTFSVYWFYIADDIDTLTTNYVKLKHWGNAIKWIDVFFELHEIHRKRARKGVVDKLEKRRSRAITMLRKK